MQLTDSLLADTSIAAYVYPDKIEFESVFEPDKKAVLPLKRVVKAESYDVNSITEKQMHIPAHPDGESGGIRTLNRDIRTPCGWI